jgi:signal transduction histidine kinase
MKHFIQKTIVRNFKRIPYFFETKPKIYFEQNNYALIGKLSTSLLHDILTPLTSLSLTAEIKSDDIQTLKPIIEHSTNQISEYIEILKNFLEYDTSKQRTHINPEISKCLSLLRHKALAHNIQIQYIEFDQIYTAIHPLHIYQIIINLVSNAIEASIQSENKKIIIILRKFKNNFYIDCRDYGEGISKEQLSKICTYNFSTKSKERGFGLYSITYIIENILKGIIHIESESNQGSLFSCEIPLT